jgi:hypothetical protein
MLLDGQRLGGERAETALFAGFRPLDPLVGRNTDTLDTLRYLYAASPLQ